MSRHRVGFTIVELLVVTGMLVGLLGLTLTMGRSGSKGSVKRSAQEFASMLLAAQSRALGKPEGAAVLIRSDGNGRPGKLLFEAQMLPFVVAGVSGMPPENPSSSTASVTVDANASILEQGYKIRFEGSCGGGDHSAHRVLSPWFHFTPPGTVTFRQSGGQTGGNTIWPKAVESLQAVVARYPLPGATPVTLPKNVAIDLRHSGVGDSASASHGYGRFEAQSDLAVAYDQIGRVGEVMRRVGDSSAAADPLSPNQLIYFLFVSREEIDSGRNTLASPQAIWVAINPLTGRVTVAENVPQTGENDEALRNARTKAREGISVR